MIRSRPEGFTLVELAIVLFVITLILTTMMRGGGNVTDGARTTSLISLTKDMGVAAREFKSRYGYHPGDLPNAATLITFDGGVSPGCSYAVAGNVGNGLADTATERTCSVEHLVKARMTNRAELVTGVFVIKSPIGAGEITIGHNAATNDNVVRITQVPCAVANEIDRKLDNQSLTPLSVGYVVGQRADGTPINTCIPEIADDPVPVLLVKY